MTQAAMLLPVLSERTTLTLPVFRYGSTETGAIQISGYVPGAERWLHDAPHILASIKKGLTDAAAGRVTVRSFAQYADLDIDND